MHKHHSAMLALAAMSVVAMGHTPPPIHPAPERSSWRGEFKTGKRSRRSTRTKPMRDRKH